jgi:hypothetical protein
MRSIPIGIMALSIWFFVESGGTQGRSPAEAALQPAPQVAFEQQAALPCPSFAERFYFGQHLASFADRFMGERSPDRAPVRSAAGEERADEPVTLAALDGRSAREAAPFTPVPLAGRSQLRLGDTSASRLPFEFDRHTAIYDISAHTVFLPDGRVLEAHSGLGSRLDDPRYVGLKSRGPTPPNVYDLELRDGLFHGVRALRLTPVGDGKMFGRDGILAHSYMLGRSGQSNGCVAFNNYPAFLRAFLDGEVDRLVVVEHLAGAPRFIAARSHGQNL